MHHQVPTVPAEALKAARGIDAYWVAWPGVDVSAAAPTLLFLHGGGLCAGSAHSSAGFLDRISRIFAMRVLALDYPLCPEATPSEAVASALAAYSHLIDDLKVPPKKVLLVGVSGGGTLALLTAEAIAGRGLPAPAAAWLISVWAGSRDAAILARHARACETDALFANGNTIAFMLVRLGGAWRGLAGLRGPQGAWGASGGLAGIRSTLGILRQPSPLLLPIFEDAAMLD